MRPPLEIADIFGAHEPAYRLAQGGHLSLGQLTAMSAIKASKASELGGHLRLLAAVFPTKRDRCERLLVPYLLLIRPSLHKGFGF